jgi:hypothetical protein
MKQRINKKAIPFLNTSKMMSFTNFLNTTKNDVKKESDDKSLVDACMRKYKSVKSLKRLNTTSTFEDYYSSVKASCQSKMFKKSLIRPSLTTKSSRCKEQRPKIMKNPVLRTLVSRRILFIRRKMLNVNCKENNLPLEVSLEEF